MTNFVSEKFSWEIRQGDALSEMRKIPDGTIDLIMTSPPYWGLRDYQVDGQLGLEPHPQEYLEKLWAIFDEVKRVLKPTGCCFVNMGDTYGSGGERTTGRNDHGTGCPSSRLDPQQDGLPDGTPVPRAKMQTSKADSWLKPKNLLLIPARFAIGMQERGWWVRNDIVWCLGGGTTVYARTQKGEMPMMVKDMVRLDPSTVQLWNGEKWTQCLGWSEAAAIGYELRLRSGERITCSPGHKWPTQRGAVPAHELRVGDTIKTTTIPEPETPRCPTALVDEDIGWFVGLYLAEGSLGQNGNCIQFSGNVNEVDRLRRLRNIAEAFDGSCRAHNTGGQCQTINIFSPPLLGILRQYISGKGAKCKHLSMACWQRSNAFLLSVLQGYLDGDGHYDKLNDRWRLGFTRNYALEQDLRTLGARLGIRVRINLSTAQCAGKTYKAFRGEVRFDMSSHPHHWSVKDNGEIVSIQKAKGRKFFDIGVADEPHTFALASGVLTHNSKPNAMPSSVKDRFSCTWEHIFFFTKAARYWFDLDAVREAHQQPELGSRVSGEWVADTEWNHNRTGTQGHNPLGKNPGDCWRLPKEEVEAAQQALRDYGLRYGYFELAPGEQMPEADDDHWTIPTCPFPEAHFAVYPPELIRKPIRAGCPPKVCVECGRPWERIVEKTDMPDASAKGSHFDQGKTAEHQLNRAQNGDRYLNKTIGWQPTCTCGGETRPGVTYDPFAGAHTTGVVCIEENRDYIGSEISADYNEIGRKRLEKATRSKQHKLEL